MENVKTHHTHKYFPWLTAFWFAVSLGHPAKAEIVRNVVPANWQAAEVAWSGDVSPRNKIDDAIDVDVASPSFEVLVNYKTCVTESDVQELLQLAPTATVRLRSKYLSTVILDHVRKQAVTSISSLTNVAFVEMDKPGSYLLDISVPTICATPGSVSCAGNVEQNYGYDGTGRTVAILDSGVNNTTHDAFIGTVLVGGIDASSGTAVFTDPVDLVVGHGTWVASIALGHAFANGSRGVAPGARLVDASMGPALTTGKAIAALEALYDKRSEWGIDVISIQAKFGSSDDGTDALSQLVDLAESMNVVVVAAVGNDGPSNVGFSSPAAATRAITVAASDDGGTSDRSDDSIWTGSNKGKRASDGDFDKIDELKPEVTAPGVAITGAKWDTTSGAITAPGTSAAAPHVAGLVALIRQANPGMNAASVKELIIRTAERRGTPSDSATDPEWNNRWGWGLVNAFAAVNTAADTDLTYPSDPPNPIWMSPDISVIPAPQVAQKSTVTVMVQNKGPAVATNAQVHFGVHDFSASIPVFSDIGTRIVTLPVGTTAVTMDWTPNAAGHMCMKTEIGYGPDTNYANNTAQRNLQIAQSPVAFEVQNTLTEDPATIAFVPTFAHQYFCARSGAPCTPAIARGAGVNDPCGACEPQTWTVAITPPSVTLAAEDCPAEVQVLLTPPAQVPNGETQIVHVAAKIGSATLGGVSVQKTVNNNNVPALSFWGQAGLVTLLVGAGLLMLARWRLQ